MPTTPAWRNGRRGGLRQNLSARRETGDAELLKVGETLKRGDTLPLRRRETSNGNPEPSLLTEEGVETRRAAPNPRNSGYGEGIVQTPNLDDSAPRAHIREGGESRRGKKIRCSQGRVGSTPSAGTKVSPFVPHRYPDTGVILTASPPLSLFCDDPYCVRI
jgi:hypothetical protein